MSQTLSNAYATTTLAAFRGVSLQPETADTPVISGIDFALERGRTTAVLGLSGCGKTVLLQLIAGRLDLPSFGFRGAIEGPGLPSGGFADDASAAEAVFAALRPRVSYVPPDDVVFGFDTPREAIAFRHRLAFGSTAEEASEAAGRLLVELGLEKCGDNMIAPGVGLRGISGGQRRRTCIAMALATQPDILVLDEPTTGLDSTTAKQVMASVQQLAVRYNCAVVQSLQQPGSDLFPHFDDLIMLKADGSLEYAGPTQQGPASIPKSHELKMVAAAGAGSSEDAEMVSVGDDESVVEPKTPVPAERFRTEQTFVLGSASLPFVTMLVIRRHFRALVRNPLALMMRIVQNLFIGIFFGTVFFDMQMTTDNMKQVLGFLLVFATSSFIPVQTGAAVFPMEKPVFLEEQKLPFKYPAAVYGFSKFVTESAAAMPMSIVFALIMGGMVGLPGDSLAKMCLTSLLLSATAEGFGFMISTMAPPEVSIAVLTPAVAFITMVIGTSLAAGAGPTEEFFDVAKHLAYIRNGYAAAAIDIFSLVTEPCTPGTLCLFPDAEAAVKFYKLDDTTEGQEWGLLGMWTVIFRVGSMVTLSVVAALNVIKYDTRKHRRAPMPSGDVAVHVADSSHGHVRDLVLYKPEPGVKALQWDVKFTVRPRWGEGSDVDRVILNPMQGVAHGGRTLAVMGGSGAGKSTLLEALSIRLPGTNVFTHTKRETEITLTVGASCLRDMPAEARALIGFVHQDPHFADNLTALEVVSFAITTATRTEGHDVEGHAHALLKQLGLEHAAGVEAGLLSGSQRKRLAVAAALAQERPIVMLDEPTSGLDPESALQLLQLLHELAHECGVVVLYTLHQPGDELLPHIDDLLLLSAGRVVYHGALEDADSHFGLYPRPEGMNATDHYLELSSNEVSRERLIGAWDARIAAAHEPFDTPTSATIKRDEREAALASHEGLGLPAVGFFALVKRSFTITVLRASLPSLLGRFFALYILIPLVLGLAMYDQAGSSMMALRNATFAYTMASSFVGLMIPMMDFHLERLLFLREQESSNYSPVAYYVARVFAAVPMELLGLLFNVNIAYWMVGFTADAGAYFIFVLATFLLQQCIAAVGKLLGVLIHSLVVSSALGSLTFVLFASVSGVIIDPATINESKWLHGMEFFSPTRQAHVLLLRNEARHRPNSELVESLLAYDRWFDEPAVLWAVLIFHVIFWRLLAAMAFKFTTRAGSYSKHGKL